MAETVPKRRMGGVQKVSLGGALVLIAQMFIAREATVDIKQAVDAASLAQKNYTDARFLEADRERDSIYAKTKDVNAILEHMSKQVDRVDSRTDAIVRSLGRLEGILKERPLGPDVSLLPKPSTGPQAGLLEMKNNGS